MLDKDIVNINENYINYIQSNPKLVLSVEDLAVADTGTTGHYLTLNFPCCNKRKLSSQVALLTVRLATAQAENVRMKKSRQQSTTAGNGHRASRNTTPSETNTPQDRNLYSRRGQRFDPNGCCSSHGYKVEESHTSATYRFPGRNHNKSATRLNIMGGKTWNKEWNNGGPTD